MPLEWNESAADPQESAFPSPNATHEADCQGSAAATTGQLGNTLWRPANGESESKSDLDLWIAPSAARDLRATIARAAPTDATVLIVGESGTGKEVTARLIHHVSRRRGPFVPVNMAAIPRELAESQLFGHEKGAFTGASGAHCGFCEAANGGTLFLDEFTEMEPGLQAKLLRFLEDRTVQRVGSTVALSVDVRVIAATNRDPEQAVRDHQLREDVFYRLNVISIRLPALRERPLDVCRLAEIFLAEANHRYKRNVHGFAPAAMQQLQTYHWPGNIRELKNCVERMVILTSDSQISLADLPDAIIGNDPIVRNDHVRNILIDSASPAPGQTPRRMLAYVEEQAILDELLKCDGNVLRTARSLGIARSTLYRKLKGIHRSAEDAAGSG